MMASEAKGAMTSEEGVHSMFVQLLETGKLLKEQKAERRGEGSMITVVSS